MLSEPIKASDVRVKSFSGVYPWDIEQDMNDWFEDAGEGTRVLDIAYHFSLDGDGVSGPIWALLTFARNKS